MCGSHSLAHSHSWECFILRYKRSLFLFLITCSWSSPLSCVTGDGCRLLSSDPPLSVEMAAGRADAAAHRHLVSGLQAHPESPTHLLLPPTTLLRPTLQVDPVQRWTDSLHREAKERLDRPCVHATSSPHSRSDHSVQSQSHTATMHPLNPDNEFYNSPPHIPRENIVQGGWVHASLQKGLWDLSTGQEDDEPQIHRISLCDPDLSRLIPPGFSPSG